VSSYVETGACHLPFADPYCGPTAAAVAAADSRIKVGGTMVVIEGPRFSTRAESRHYADQGWALINMTGAPEAALAREMRQCYAAIALVTDMDAGAESGQGVGQAEVFALFKENLERLTGLLADTIARLPDPAGCSCSTWADEIELTYEVPGPRP
jgi:5'-methylthioadenosine phosphorylase